jgi:hypothetical protein
VKRVLELLPKLSPDNCHLQLVALRFAGAFFIACSVLHVARVACVLLAC